MSSQIRVFDESAHQAPLVQQELLLRYWKPVPTFPKGTLTLAEKGFVAVLFELKPNGQTWIEATNEQIAEAAEIHPSNVSRYLNAIEAKGEFRIDQIGRNRRVTFLYGLRGLNEQVKDVENQGSRNHLPRVSEIAKAGFAKPLTQGKRNREGRVRDSAYPPYKEVDLFQNSNSETEEEKEKQNAREIVDAGGGTPSTTPAKTNANPGRTASTVQPGVIRPNGPPAVLVDRAVGRVTRHLKLVRVLRPKPGQEPLDEQQAGVAQCQRHLLDEANRSRLANVIGNSPNTDRAKLAETMLELDRRARAALGRGETLPENPWTEPGAQKEAPGQSPNSPGASPKNITPALT